MHLQNPPPSPTVLGAEWEEALPFLAAEAATLPERLSGDAFTPLGGDEAIAREHWKIWTASLSKENPDFLETRLAFSGWEMSSALPRLGLVRITDREPEWTLLFREALAEAAKIDWDAAPKGDTFYEPFLQVARTRLAKATLPDPKALAPCEVSLRQRLEAVAGEVVAEEGRPAADWYARPDLFRQYPVAARRLSEITEYWIEALAEFLSRLQRDLPEIRGQLFAGREIGPVAELSGFASDSHARGRAVLIVRFAHGDRVVYKPRSLGLESAYYEMLAWLENHGAPVILRAARVIDHGNYGWMEWIARADCAAEEEVPAFYRRMGGLLALSHALAGGDIHFENLIARGNHPIVIDTEVWMTPTLEKPEIFGGELALQAAWNRLLHSVLNSAILPAWIPIGRDRSWNIGALEAETGLEGMLRSAGSSNLPRWQGRIVYSRHHRQDILSGFRAMYEFFLSIREKLLASDGPLRAFAGQPARFVNRPTELYSRALRRSFRPASLRSGLARSLQLEAFLKPALHAEGRDQQNQFAIGSSEIFALERGDIPFFQGRIGSHGINLPEIGREIADFFTRNGLDIAQGRLRELSAEGLAWQSQVIVMSFDLIGDRPAAPEPDWLPEPVDFRAAANAIAREIMDSATIAGGDPAWVAPLEVPGGHFALAPMNVFFYDGILGTMVFLLAAERSAGNAEAGQMARRIFALVSRMSRQPLQQTLRQSSPPGLAGLGGNILALCLAHRLGGEAAPLNLARFFATQISEDYLLQPWTDDLYRGKVGLLLGLETFRSTANTAEVDSLIAILRAKSPPPAEGIEGVIAERLSGRDAREKLTAAALAAARPELSPADQLFSGNASRANLLLSAATQLNNESHRLAAENLLRRACVRARANGGFICYGNHAPTVTGPGFFQGLAGIGYTMLRLADPSLPGVLLD